MKKTTITREQITAAIERCAKKLRRSPTLREFKVETRISQRIVRQEFKNWSNALKSAGLESCGMGRRPDMEELFRDWAEIVRMLKKIPGREDYTRHSKFSVSPFLKRFTNWQRIPTEMHKYIVEKGLTEESADVLTIINEHKRAQQISGAEALPWQVRRWEDRPFYGAPMTEGALACEPLNEAGVMVLFGAVARELGFVIQRVQAQFPDCEAWLEVEPGKWQKVWVEFEFASRNFLQHQHDKGGCDLIVCWVHNWPECPLPVLELKTEVRRLLVKRAYRQNALWDRVKESASPNR